MSLYLKNVIHFSSRKPKRKWPLNLGILHRKLLIKAQSVYFSHIDCLVPFILSFYCEYMSKTCFFVFFASPAIPLGLIVVPGDSDLETCREHIQRLQEVRSQALRKTNL